MEEKERKNRIILIIIFTLTILVTIAGTTFAYLSVNIFGNETASSILFKTQKLGITYDSGPNLIATLDYGNFVTKTFRVTNTGDSAVVYNIVWTNVTNNFGIPDELKYTVVGSLESGTGSAGNLSSTTVPTGNGTMISGVTINPNTTHAYTVRIDFIDPEIPRDDNQGKIFIGRIQINAD